MTPDSGLLHRSLHDAASERDGAAIARVLVGMGGIPLYGQERGNIQVFKTLQDQGVDALFVTHAGYGHERIQPELDRLGLTWTVGRYPRLWSVRDALRTFSRQSRDLVGGCLDFVRAARAYRPTHVHMMNERYLLNLLPAVWTLRLPVVFRLGDVPRQHRLLYRLIWRRLLIPSVSEFVCISEFIRDCLIQTGAPPERVRVIRSAPTERSDGPDDLPPDLATPPPGQPVMTVAYVGQLSARKGVDLLVEVALRLCRARADIRFLIAGDYTWQNPFAEALMETVAREGLADRIRFLGYVDDVDGLMDLADILCVPSVMQEPLGNVVQEAKRAAVPSVVFPSGGLPELVLEPGLDGVVCHAPTADALEAGLVHYLDMPADQRRRAGAAARSSLVGLGLTAGAFAQAWARVFADTARTPRENSRP